MIAGVPKKALTLELFFLTICLGVVVVAGAAQKQPMQCAMLDSAKQPCQTKDSKARPKRSEYRL